MNPALVPIFDKIEEILIPGSTANAVVIFANGEKTNAVDAICQVIRCIRLNRKPLGILFHTLSPPPAAYRVETFGRLSPEEQAQFDGRVARFLNGLKEDQEYDDDWDEFYNEEEEEAAAII